MDDKVILTNMVNAVVSVNIPDIKLKREWPRKGAKVAIDKTTFEEAIYDAGFEYMIKNGILYTEDMALKKQLGLEPETAVKPENIIVLDDKQIHRLLTVAPVSELRDTLKKLSLNQRQNVIDYAIDKEIADISRSDIIKEICDVNILRAIELKRANEEKVD